MKAISESLYFNRSIAHLDVSSNNIDNEGFSNLFRVLHKNEFIISLEIGSKSEIKNKLNVDGMRSLISMLQVNKVISHLNMQKLNFKAEGMELFLKFLKNNDTLLYANMQSNCIDGTAQLGEDLASFLKSSKLAELVLSDNKLGNAFMEKFSLAMQTAKSKIRKLTLDNIDINGNTH